METIRPDRRAIERVRRALLGHDPGEVPLCSAPFSSLVLDGDGSLRACAAATRALLPQASPDLRVDFDTPELAVLRGALSRGELPRDHCARCIERIDRGPTERAPLLTDHGNRTAATGGGGPAHLLVRLAEDTDPITIAQQVGSLFGRLQELEIEAPEPLSHPALSAILELARRLPQDKRPELALRLQRVGDLDRARRLLQGLHLARIRVQVTTDLDRQLAASAELLPDGGALVAALTFDADNWAELFAIATTCATHDTPLLVSTSASGQDAPLAALPLAELRVMSSLLGSTWHLFTDAARPASLAPDAYDMLRAEVRQIALRKAEAGDPRRAAPRHLAVPPLDNALMRDPGLGAIVTRVLLGLDEPAVLDAWFGREQRREDFEGALVARPWLRLLLYKTAGTSPGAGALACLRSLFDDAEQREEMLAADREFGANEGVAAAVSHWHEWFGFDRLGPRPRSFTIPPATPADTTSEPRVTVLIPSFRHEVYIEECVRSALAQRDAAFVVHVCDDASPDATAERARAIDDPRLQVFENPTNLGLGNSVLAALERIETPFVALLNSDDAFHPDRLARCLAVIEGDDAAQVVATDLTLVDADGGEITPDNACRLRDTPMVYDWVQWYRGAQPRDIAHDDVFAELLQHNFLATSSNLLCRTAFLREQADELRSLKYCLDWHIFLEAARTGGLRYIAEPLASYRLHASNTVWFREGHRWSYFLEVSRVAAAAVQRDFETRASEDRHEAARRTLAAAVDRLTRNTEVDGMAMFLNELLGGIELDQLSQSDAERARIEVLNDRAERLTRLSHAARDLDNDELTERVGALERLTTLEAARLTLDLLREDRDAQRERGRRSEQRMYLLEDELTEQLDARELRAELEAERRLAAEAGTRMLKLQRNQANLRVELHEAQRQQQELMRVRNKTAIERDNLRKARDHLDQRRLEMRVEIQGLRDDCENMNNDLVATHREIVRLNASTEMKIGRLLWNKIPLFAKARRLAKRLWGRTRGLVGRARLTLDRKLRPHGPGVIKVAAGSTAQFPVISHTFVYQELTALHDMAGADVKLFHTQSGDADGLHAAFRYLDEHRTHYVSNWDVHIADFHHYKKTRPDRVESLLAALSEASGIGRPELEQRFELMLAFTHTRRLDSWGADYVHTYFFYDQALNGLVAAWILDLPRGVSTYADHMMTDWPLKVVPLHLRSADVIVATSQRIRRELIEIGGDEVADKIIVKPNGVDGERFPFVTRTPVVDRPLELICISRIEPKKGMVELAETARILKSHGRAFHVHVIGGADTGHASSEDYARRVEQKVEHDGTGDVVTFHGRMKQEQMRPLLERADAFIAPFVETESGDKDGIPTAILEAMSTGLPIIATDAGSITEIIDDGVEGMVVAQRDPAALAAAVERLLDDPELGANLGRAARARFEAEFDIRTTEPRFHARVNDAVNRRRALQEA